MQETLGPWAMMLIGCAAVLSGIVGYLLPDGERLSVVLALLIGAGVGVVAIFAQALLGGLDDPDTGARTFFVSSLLGFVSVLTGLGVLLARARARRR
jgi:hypothetical protein